MLQLAFRLRRDRPASRATAAHPGARLVVWCNLTSDLVELHAPSPKAAEDVFRELAQGARRMVPLPPEGKRHRALLMGCSTDPAHSVTLLVERHGGLVLPPILVEEGWETFRAALFEEAEAEAFFRALGQMGRYELLQKRRVEQPAVRESFLLPAAELLGGLTRKQGEALAMALQEGYYRVPRTANLQDIAKRRGVPRTTMEEHLRKAEAKVLTALGPFLALHLHEQGTLPAPEQAPEPKRRPVAARQRA